MSRVKISGFLKFWGSVSVPFLFLFSKKFSQNLASSPSGSRSRWGGDLAIDPLGPDFLLPLRAAELAPVFGHCSRGNGERLSLRETSCAAYVLCFAIGVRDNFGVIEISRFDLRLSESGFSLDPRGDPV